MTDSLDSQLYNLFDVRPAHIVSFLQWLAAHYHLPPDLHFLDVGCGTGRLLQPCAALGWCVDALEPHTDYYTAASQIALLSAKISVQQGGFEAIAATATYHFIAAVNAPFAYLLTPAEREAALMRVFAALKPGGIVFVDVYNFLWTLHHYRPPQPSYIRNDSGEVIQRVIRHEIDWHASTFTHIDEFYRSEQLLSTQVHRMAMLTPQEVWYLATKIGFQSIQTYNNFAAREHQRINNNRIMLSAQKPL